LRVIKKKTFERRPLPNKLLGVIGEHDGNPVKRERERGLRVIMKKKDKNLGLRSPDALPGGPRC